METRKTAKPSSASYEQLYAIGGKILNGGATAVVNVATNVAEAAKAPVQPEAKAYQVHAACLSASASVAIIDLLSGNWIRAGLEAAVSTYCAYGLVNQIGKQGALNLAISAPKRFMGLFYQATPAPTAPVAPEATAENTANENDENAFKPKQP